MYTPEERTTLRQVLEKKECGFMLNYEPYSKLNEQTQTVLCEYLSQCAEYAKDEASPNYVSFDECVINTLKRPYTPSFEDFLNTFHETLQGYQQAYQQKYGKRQPHKL